MVSKIFTDKNEILIFIVFIAMLMVFVISLLQLPIYNGITIEWLKKILLSDGVKTISSGIVSGYILYIFIELKPKYERERKTIDVLNQTIASVLEAYFEGSNKFNFTQHEKSIKHVKFELKTASDRLREAIKNIKDKEINYWQLKICMQTAHSRYSDFQNLLILAVTLSPKHGLYWLDLTDKIRLLADEYNNHPAELDMNVLTDLRRINPNIAEMNPTELFCSSLELRVLEFFESVVDWINLEKTRIKLNYNEQTNG